MLAYGLGDFGCNMSFALKGTLTIFWTQYMGIDSILMASLLLLVQVWDAINDPVIGAMVDADKRQYKRNKFLAYIWAGSVGLLVAGALCFVPWTGAPYVVKCILFVAGYILWDAFYTVANVPYGSMLSLITADPVERAKLSTGRSVGSMVGSISASVILPMLIYDASNNLLGERIFIIALVMGILGFIAFQFMIRNTVVRVDTQVTLKEDAPKFNPLKATARQWAPRWPLSACSSVCTALKLLFKSCSNPILKTLVFPVSSACFLMSACSCSSPLLAKSSAKSARRKLLPSVLVSAFWPIS